MSTSLLARSALQEIPANTKAISNAHFVVCMGDRLRTVEMRTLNLLLRHFMPLFGSSHLPRTLILMACGFSALVINRISIDYGETNLSIFSGAPYEKIIGCNLLHGSR